MSEVYKFPEITSVNANGRQTFWRIEVWLINSKTGNRVPIKKEWYEKGVKIPEHIHAQKKVYSGILGGKVRDTPPTTITKGKNLGRSNETNVLTQALSEAQSEYNKHIRKTTKTDADELMYPPMLAQTYTKPPEGLAFIQRKFNGVRAVARKLAGDSDVIIYSRTRKIYHNLEHIRVELAPIFVHYKEKTGDDIYLDGELYSHGMSLQELSGLARLQKNPAVKKLDYMIYDCFIPNKPELLQKERFEILNELKKFTVGHVKIVQTIKVCNEAEIQKYFKKFIDEGYEGAMIRGNTPYVYSFSSRRSQHLQKLKETYDGEYTIVDYVIPTRGKTKGAIIIVAETDQGHRFNITPALTIPERIELGSNIPEFKKYFMGKKIIVYYNELSERGVPMCPRTKLEIRTWD